jgi:hypothetical protein
VERYAPAGTVAEHRPQADTRVDQAGDLDADRSAGARDVHVDRPGIVRVVAAVRAALRWSRGWTGGSHLERDATTGDDPLLVARQRSELARDERAQRPPGAREPAARDSRRPAVVSAAQEGGVDRRQQRSVRVQ